MKVYLATLGCKLNESELEAWMRQFAERGDEIVQNAHEADLCVVNTCTVTQVAAHKSRGLIKKVAQRNGGAPIVVTGCYATMAPEQAHVLPGVAFVVPNRDKDRLVALTGEYRGDSGYEMAESGCRMPEASSGELASQVLSVQSAMERGSGAPHPRTRAFVKIEDGCNMACTYCIIPLARGRARSRPQDEIVGEVARLVESGYREVILTGVQISDYMLENRQGGGSRLRGLCALVRAILDETALPRLRLTSIAPWDLDQELLDLFSDSRLCRHLHLSLQSGSDTVLRRMRRPYTARQFEQAVELARAKVPEVGITTDVIVGFPGESDTEFTESLRFVERLDLARVHVFPYSAREGTAAAQLPLQVSDPVKEARAKAMQQIAAASARRFAESHLGRTMPVLYEAEASRPAGSKRSGGAEEAQEGRVWSGHTDNYIRVAARSEESLENRIRWTRLDEVIEDGAAGSLV